eukprot:CAMPEP_0172692590 /NCGR_PEP_ID=MMETSP1074-20121228/25368_1 /TAXON_ID=2916 /ORGANISM="Ceratium fusus, Strain PA161109" /LENGTH=167 /DNA_ID=CAMNT_0013512833 /DNA_START=126 /DNA_END=629 /DNA_ORIENTATION=+
MWTDQAKISITPSNGIGHHKYCRNPDESADTPWCFVHGAGLDEIKKEACSVDECEDEDRDFQAEAEALKRFMGSRDCDCSLFLQLGNHTGAFDNMSQQTHPGKSADLSISVDAVKALMNTCRQEKASHANTSSKPAAQLHLRRSCGLTEVLVKRCACNLKNGSRQHQ